MRHALLLPVLALIGACDGPVPALQEGQLEIAPYRRPCVGFGEHLCLLVREPGAREFHLMYDEILGLKPRWGHRYVVEVTTRERVPPLLDVSSIEWLLTRIVSDDMEAPETMFPFPVWYTCHGCDPYLTVTGGTTGHLLDGTAFACETTTVCIDLDRRIAARSSFSVDLRFTPGGLAPLTVSGARSGL